MDMNVEQMLERPFLPHDLIYIPTETGLAFQRGHRVMSVNGRDAYDRFSRLAPRLNGGLSILSMDALLAPHEIRPMERLLSVLMQRDFLLPYDVRLDDLPAEIRNEFDQQIRFLHHLSPRPAAAFLDFRGAVIRVAGRGEALEAAVAALERNGADGVRRLRDLAGCAKADLVLCVSETPNLSRVLAVSRACQEAGVAFLAAIVIAGSAVIGPFVEPGSATSWEDALLRILEHQTAAVRAGVWRHIALGAPWMEDALPPGAPQLQIVGNHVAFAAFMALCGVRRSLDLIETISLETLDTRSATLLPHPSRSRRRDGVWQAPPRGPQPPAIKPTGFDSLGLVGSVCGVFHAFEDDDLHQVPVFRSRLRARLDPTPHDDGLHVANSFQSNAQARALALAAAACHYAVTSAADRAPRLPAAGQEVVRAGRIASLLIRGGQAGVRALEADVRTASTQDGARQAGVPAAALRAPVGASAVEPESAVAGTGCATTAEDARRRATLSLLRFEALKAVALRHASLTRIELLPGAPGLMGLYDVALQHGWTLQAAGLGVHDCFVSVIAPGDALTDPARTTVGCGASMLDATREALVEAVSLATGGESALTVDRLLPARLGYQRVGWPVRPGGLPTETLELDRLCPGPGDDGDAALLHADVTPSDLSMVGLHVAKVVLARLARADA